MSNQTAKKALGATLFEGHGSASYGDGSGSAIVDNLTDFFVQFSKPAADSMAADATAATTTGWTNPYDFNVVVVSGKLVSASTLTAHADNNAVITLQVDDAANGTPAVALTWTTSVLGTGNWAADTAEANTGRTAANCTVVPGACLHYAIAKGGTGVVVPITHFVIRLRRLG